jgi:arylsulfatase
MPPTLPLSHRNYRSAASRFRGNIAWVQIDLGDDDDDHHIDDEDRLRIAMAKQ